jgi:hypothetical protein
MTDLDRLKSLLNLADLVAQTHPLTGSGRYRHGQKHDSLVIDTLHQEYWWNSKGEWGDILDWIGRYYLGYEAQWRSQDPAMFKEAIRALAQLAGQPEPTFKPEDPQARQQRLDRQRLLDLALDYYHAQFLAHQPAQLYTVSRGWTTATTTQAKLGYSDGKLIAQIPQTDRDLAKTIGLLAERDGRWFDAIPAGCLVYPHLIRGRAAYFSGRTLEGKRHYNLHAPKEMFWAIPAGYGGHLVIVEGQADALSVMQWGLPSLALCGVNLAALDTEILRLFNRIFVAVDQDKAGQNTLDPLARAIDPLLRLVEWPTDGEPAKDANELLQAGFTADEFRNCLGRSKTYLDHIIDRVQITDHADWDEALQQLFELLALLDPLPLTRYRAKICRKLALNRTDFDRLLGIARNDTDLGQAFKKGEQFTVQEGWTIYKQHTPTGRIDLIPLCNASITIVELIERDNGSGDVLREYRLRGELANGKKLPDIQVPTAEFPAMAWVAQHWPDVIIGAGRGIQDGLREAIQHLSGEFPRRVVYEHTGWRNINGHWAYLTTTGALGLPESDSATIQVQVDLNLGRPDTYMNLYQLPTHPQEVNQAIMSSLSFWNLAAHTITIPQWAAIYLAPLSPFLPPDFGIWVYGKSGSFKSVYAALALAHFGRWSGREARHNMPANFGSTANNILMNAFIVKDCLLVIDDFAPGNTIREMRERDEVASRLLRSVGNRAARGRMKDGRRFQADFPPRCLPLITAEDVPPGQSIQARSVGVRVYTPPPGSPERAVIDARVSQAQEDDALRYPHAMATYLLWLKRHWDELSTTLKAGALTNQKRFASNGHARLADAFGKLMTAVDTALFCFQDTGAITASQAQDYRATAYDSLRAVMAEHAGQIESLDPCLIFTQILREELDAQSWFLAPANPDDPPPANLPHTAIKIGWQDNRYVYLLSKTVSSIMEIYSRAGVPFPVGRNTLYLRLQEKGWLLKMGTEYIPAINTSPHVLRLMRQAIYPEEGGNYYPEERD